MIIKRHWRKSEICYFCGVFFDSTPGIENDCPFGDKFIDGFDLSYQSSLVHHSLDEVVKEHKENSSKDYKCKGAKGCNELWNILNRIVKKQNYDR